MMKPSEHDRVTVARYVDGEMTAAERAAFETRLAAEPALSESLTDTQALRGIFAVARDEVSPVLRSGLAERVLQRLRRGDGGDVGAEFERKIVRLSRVCMVAAAIVLTVAMMFAAGVLRLPDGEALQADASAELIRTLDAKIQAAQAQRALGR